MTGVSGMYPLGAATLLKLRKDGFIPLKPVLVCLDVVESTEKFIQLNVPSTFRPYRLNWSPVVGLDVVIIFAQKTSYASLFETYECLSAIGANSVTAKLQGSEIYFPLLVSNVT